MIHPLIPINRVLVVRHTASTELFIYSGDKEISQETIDDVVNKYLDKEKEIAGDVGIMTNKVYEFEINNSST